MDSLSITFESSHDGSILTHYEPSLELATSLPHTVRPSYVTFVGKRCKTMLLNRLLGNSVSLPVHKQVYLWSSPRLRSGNTPLVIIDCNVQNSTAPDPNFSEVTKSSSAWPIHEPSNIGALLCGKLFSQFSSVTCCFVSDLGGPKAVASWLADQVIASLASDLPTTPRILLVVETLSDEFDESIAATKATTQLLEALMRTKLYSNVHEMQQDMDKHFGAIEVLGLHSLKPTSVRARALKRRLLALSQANMLNRAQSRTQFTFAHFSYLSKQMLSHICSGSTEPLCVALTTRPAGFSSSLLEPCLRDFLQQIPSQAWLWHFVAPLIGSALVLASYPPGSHGSCIIC